MKWILVALMMGATTLGVGSAAEAVLKKTRTPASADQRSEVSDVVKKIREDDEGLVILFNKNAGSYYLRRDVAEFDVYRKKLEESLVGKKPVSVTYEPSQLNILEVK